jgi:hypothetical protein
VSEIYCEYNGDYLTDAQIELLHAAFVADLDAMAAGPDVEPEAEP